MTKRSLVSILLAAGTLLPAASAHAQTTSPTPSGSIGIRLLEAPVNRENDPRARTYIVDHIGQGTTISRKIEVLNGTTSPQTIRLYSGAATVSNGAFNAAPGQGGNDVADWTSVSPSDLTVGSGQTAQAMATISVPRDALNGERYGVIWADRVSAPNGNGITVVNRVGIRIYLSVGVGAEPPTDFTIETLQAKRLETGEPAVAAMVRNIGGRALDMSGKLELKDGPGGLNAGPFPAELGTTLAPGEREPVLVKLDKRIPAGPWDAMITLRSSTIEHSAHARLTFPASGVGRPVKAESLADKVKILLPIAGIVLAMIVGLIIAWRRRRKDKYGEVKADLKRFEKAVKAQEGGAAVPLTTTADNPVAAIRSAIKQSKRTGDEKTAAKLESRLNALLERQASITRPEAPPRADDVEVKLREKLAELREQEAAPPPPPSAPPPAPPNPAASALAQSRPFEPMADAAGEDANGPTGEDDRENVVAILRELATAPPGAHRFALVKAARAYGRDAIEAHPAELAALPEELRLRLQRELTHGAGGNDRHTTIA